MPVDGLAGPGRLRPPPGGRLTDMTARLPLILTELRLPTIKWLWGTLAAQSNKEGWPAERFLAAVMEHELAERETRRLERHRLESQLLPGKLLSSFNFTTVPTVSKAHVTALVEGDGRIALHRPR